MGWLEVGACARGNHKNTSKGAVARFFVTGDIIASAEGTSLVEAGGGGGIWGYPPQEKFKIWWLPNVIFSTCHEICLRNIDLEQV